MTNSGHRVDGGVHFTQSQDLVKGGGGGGQSAFWWGRGNGQERTFLEMYLDCEISHFWLLSGGCNNLSPPVDPPLVCPLG